MMKAGEVQLTLPFNAAGGFVPFFQALDQQLKPFHVTSYGLSMPSLEEVFLKVTEKALGIADGVMSSWNRQNDGNGDGGYTGFAKPSERIKVSALLMNTCNSI
jgi:hypothetical protein